MTRPSQFATRTTRVMIVDDHPIVRQGYNMLLATQADLDICGEAESEADALRLAREENPDLAIVDISLANGSGIDLIKNLTARQPNLRILAASAHDESLFAERALRAGALGYINKTAAVDHLISAVRRILNGEVYLSERMTAKMLKHVTRRTDADVSDKTQLLTDRELEAFELIGQGLATREIAKRMHVSPKTVDRHRENIKRKLEVNTATELLRQATQWVLESR